MPSQGPSQIKTTIAGNLARGIEAKGYTNREVGDLIGKTDVQVWKWRAGKHTPELETLVALADVLFGGDITQFYVDLDQAA